MGPALRDDGLEMGANQALVSLLKGGMQIEDGLARAVDEAQRFAMRDRHVGADEVVGELDDHPNTAEPAALKKRRAHFRRRIGLDLGHRIVIAGNGDRMLCIPRFRSSTYQACSRSPSAQISS